MASLDFLVKGAKPILFLPSGVGELVVKDFPKMRDLAGNEVIDSNSEWILLGYQFNSGVAAGVSGSFFLEDKAGGNQKTPTHYWTGPYASQLIECFFQFGNGKQIVCNLTQGLSAVFYVWDPNYTNARRTNF